MDGREHPCDKAYLQPTRTSRNADDASHNPSRHIRDRPPTRTESRASSKDTRGEVRGPREIRVEGRSHLKGTKAESRGPHSISRGESRGHSKDGRENQGRIRSKNPEPELTPSPLHIRKSGPSITPSTSLRQKLSFIKRKPLPDLPSSEPPPYSTATHQSSTVHKVSKVSERIAARIPSRPSSPRKDKTTTAESDHPTVEDIINSIDEMYVTSPSRAMSPALTSPQPPFPSLRSFLFEQIGVIEDLEPISPTSQIIDSYIKKSNRPPTNYFTDHVCRLKDFLASRSSQTDALTAIHIINFAWTLMLVRTIEDTATLGMFERRLKNELRQSYEHYLHLCKLKTRTFVAPVSAPFVPRKRGRGRFGPPPCVSLPTSPSTKHNSVNDKPLPSLPPTDTAIPTRTSSPTKPMTPIEPTTPTTPLDIDAFWGTILTIPCLKYGHPLTPSAPSTPFSPYTPPPTPMDTPSEKHNSMREILKSIFEKVDAERQDSAVWISQEWFWAASLAWWAGELWGKGGEKGMVHYDEKWSGGQGISWVRNRYLEMGERDRSVVPW